MRKKRWSKSKPEVSTVLIHHDEKLKNIHFPNNADMDSCISTRAQMVKDLGYQLPPKRKEINTERKQVIVVSSWEALYAEADRFVSGNVDIKSLFTEEELKELDKADFLLKKEFAQIHKMDKADYAIAALAGMVGAAVDIIMIGIPQKTQEGLKAGPLSNFIRDYFDKKFPADEMQKLANSKVSKVPFDAQDNRNTTVYVQGLSAYYHRLLQLGHDPVLGFVFGVADILTGRMTTIDKNGNIVSQIMENYADRKESDIFAALSKLIIHFKSDITTSMGLPVPFMSLFNLLQFGEIGEYEQTIAEIVQGMYYEGYDFIHFCSMSVSTMLVEVIVRMGYAFKRISEGHSVKESIPVSLDREKHPKMATMLFLGHSVATASNAGKIMFSENPMAINYPQWIAFAKYSYKQLQWMLNEKKSLRDAYVSGKIYEEMQDIYNEANRNFDEYTRDKIVIYS